MEIKEFTTTIITASEGNYITQKAEVELSERIIATQIALGKFDKADNYKEITAEEAEALKQQIEEYFENKAE